MKQSSLIAIFVLSIMLMLSSCVRSDKRAKTNDEAGNQVNICDSCINKSNAEVSDRDGDCTDHKGEFSGNDVMNNNNLNIRFYSSPWGNTQGDTVIDGLAIAYNCAQTTYPEDFIRRQSERLNEYGEWVKEEVIIYGNRASIRFRPLNTAQTDTVLITRQMLVNALGRNDKSWRNDLYVLSHLKLKGVRNDSIIFILPFFMDDTDVGGPIELKFAKTNPANSMTIEELDPGPLGDES